MRDGDALGVACPRRAIAGHLILYRPAHSGSYSTQRPPDTPYPAMFRAYSIRDAFQAERQKREMKTLPKDHKPLSSSRDFTAWTISQDGKDIMSAVA